MKSYFAHSSVFKVTLQICAINNLSTKFATAEVKKVTKPEAEAGKFCVVCKVKPRLKHKLSLGKDCVLLG